MRLLVLMLYIFAHLPHPPQAQALDFIHQLSFLVHPCDVVAAADAARVDEDVWHRSSACPLGQQVLDLAAHGHGLRVGVAAELQWRGQEVELDDVWGWLNGVGLLEEVFGACRKRAM